MKTCHFIGILLLFTAFTYADEGMFGEITDMIGSVTVFSAKQNNWKPGRIYYKLSFNDRIKTSKESRAEIKSTNGGVIRINEESELLLLPAKASSSNENVKLFSGKIWANMKNLTANRRTFDVQTPTATAAIRGTVFRVNSDADSTTDVLVYEGKVDVGPSTTLLDKNKSAERTEVDGPTEVEGPTEVSLEAWITIIAGQQITVKKTGSYDKFQFDQKSDKQNDWVKFNQEKDELIKK